MWRISRNQRWSIQHTSMLLHVTDGLELCCSHKALQILTILCAPQIFTILRSKTVLSSETHVMLQISVTITENSKIKVNKYIRCCSYILEEFT